MHRLLLIFILAVVRRPKLCLAASLLVLGGCVAFAVARLSISTDQNELFSPNAPFFRDYLTFVQKFPENEAVYVIVRRADGAAEPAVRRWTAAADALAVRLRGLPEHVVSVDARVPTDQLGRQGLLFEDPQRLRAAVADTRRFTGLVRQVGEKPDPVTGFFLGPTPVQRLLGSITTGLNLGQADAGLAPFVEVVADSWNQTLDAGAVRAPDLTALDASDPGRLGYYYIVDQADRARHLLLVRVYPRRDFTSLTAISETVDAIRAAAAAVARDFPEFQFGVTGRPALEADEMRTTDEDTRRAEVVALSAVFVGLVVLFRSFWLALAAELALGVGIGWTFGWATFSVGKLNLLSMVFLLALIGIGMDYLIQILSRYRAEAGRRKDPRLIWVAVFRQVGAPINTACLGAAGAFLVSIATDFRGAAELGIIAGGGLLLCLLSGYTFLPALLTLGRQKAVEKEKGKGKKGEGESSPIGGADILVCPGAPSRERSPFRIAHTPGRSTPHRTARESRDEPDRSADRASAPRSRGWRHATTPAVWLILILAGIYPATRTGFDPGLIELQAPNLESVRLVRRLETWSAVVLTKDLKTLRGAREAVRGSPVVGRTESLLLAYDNYEYLKSQRGPDGRVLPVIRWADPPAIAAESLPGIAQQARTLAAALERPAANRGTGDPPVKSPPATRPATTSTGSPAAAATSSATTLPSPTPADVVRAAAALRTFASRLESSPDRVKAAAVLSAWQPAFLDQLKATLAQFEPAPPDVATLPVEMRGHFVSDDGTYALHIYPAEDLWANHHLGAFVTDLESRLGPVPGDRLFTGIAPNIFHSTSSIRRSFYTSTALALGLIFVLVLIDMRRLADTLLAVSVLALGLPMLVALMGLAGIDWNFANFFGLPILIGAGHEYGVFMVHRYREVLRDPRRAWRGWDVADSALLLCALVTSGSFAFFWLLGHHEGLRSLGLVMALGSACIYLATTLALRPLLRWRLEALGY